MRRTAVLIAFVATLGLVGPVAAQSEQPAPTPTPPVAGPQQVPPGLGGQQPPGTQGQTVPDLPGTPLSPETYESLSDEEKERLRHFREDTLPPGATFEEYVQYWLKPRPYPKSVIVRIDDKHAHPHPAVPWKMEIVREEGDTVWMRALPPENPESPIHKEWVRHQEDQAVMKTFKEYLPEPTFLDFTKAIVPPPSFDSMRFEPHSSELPVTGRWQMTFVLADMNADGHQDIVAPPPRKGAYNHPMVFLGDGRGGFSYWQEASWDRKVGYDYGAVDVADFDGDGHQDVALAVHFRKQWVLYGDGEGSFTAQRLPSPDPRRTSRAVAAGDVDNDGDADLAFIAEVGYDLATNRELSVPTVWVLRNEGERRWSVDTEGLPNQPVSDQIELVDMNGDGLLDVLFASNLQNWRALLFLNGGSEGWTYAEFQGVLSSAYHFGVDVIRIGDRPRPDPVCGFAQFKRESGELQSRVGVIRYPWDGSDLDAEGEVIVLGEDRNDAYNRVAVGDLDGDGRDDLVAARKQGTIRVFLQSEDGAFVEERSPELRPVGRPFHFEVADLDGDGLDDIVGGFVGEEKGVGGFRVWLSRRQP